MLFRQANFIEASINNVVEALRDGAILVAIILFAFLLNFRTTAISLIAIPLSLAVTMVVFKLLGQSINVMTLGGLAIAIGELVDDAVVDVENILRRLKQRSSDANPLSVLETIWHASVEVRSGIVYATIIVVLVFVPLFALPGIEGRLFAPLGIAYIVSILASMLVSMTVTPAIGVLPVAEHEAAGAWRQSAGPTHQGMGYARTGVVIPAHQSHPGGRRHRGHCGGRFGAVLSARFPATV